jgi:hypothetical protein
MAVFLSPVGGVAAQFFTNTGAVLTGGKLYTYAAGTTTPVATYTTSGGVIFNTNPIVLDAAGRVPGSGEIWLADGIQYKFVLKDSNDVLIATYDNVIGINASFSNFLTNQEIQTATANQTVFTLANTYTPGANTLSVFVDGVNQYGPGAQYAYIETNSSTVTFVSGLHVGASVKFTTVQSLTSTQPTTAALVSYTPAGTGAVTTTVQAKLRETVSVFDFMTAAQIASVQAKNYSLDVTLACQTALNSGATCVQFPEGAYKISGLSIGASNPNLRDIIGLGNVTLKLYTAVQSSCFEIAVSRAFVNFDNFNLDSNGSKTDGLFTYGILFVGSNAYTTAKNIRCTNFSGAGMEWRQTVYTGIENYSCNNCFYGLSFQLYNAIPCTTVTVDRAYLSGCTRGLTQTGAVAMEYRDVITEYCGSTTTTDGAFHIVGGQCQLIYPYGEENYRNWVLTEAQASIIGEYIFAATAANVVSWSGTAADQRGFVTVLPYRINTPRIGPDVLGSYDCVIGTNLTAPLAGGSVVFGNETMAVANGTLTSATWTTVYTIPTAENSGYYSQRALYEYTCYAGSADLGTGFDSGTIMNGTLRSYSGTTPAWLRLSSNTVQMNVTGTSYGLNYKIVMRRIYPG